MSLDKINQIVDVQISRETAIVDSASFNTALFYCPNVPFAELSRNYPNASALISDGFQASDPAYRAAVKYFAQNPRPTQLTVASAGVKDYDLFLVESDIVNNKDFVVTINLKDGTSKDFTATAAVDAEDDAPAEIELLVTALHTAINADVDVNTVVTSTVAGTGSTTVATLAGSAEYYTGSDDVAIDYVFNGTWADIHAAQDLYYSGFYGVGAWTHNEDEVKALAAIVNTEARIHGYSTQAPESLVTKAEPSVAGDILGQMQDLNYERSFGIYNANADRDYPEMALLGKKLTTIPGASTWMFSTLTGIISDNLSLSQSQIVLDKGGNTYEDVSGIDMLRNGTMASGEFIDVMHGSDDLHSRIQTEVFRQLVVKANGGSKVSLSDQGVQELVATVESQIRISIGNDFILENLETTDAGGGVVVIPGYEIEVGLVSDLPANIRAQRQAPDIRFQAVLASAIHKVIVRGVLSI